MGYHSRSISKGIVGEFSKIKEEWEELEDAYLQGDKILEICELTDLIGAIEAYSEKHYKISLIDIKKFSDKTKEAFKEGKRA